MDLPTSQKVHQRQTAFSQLQHHRLDQSRTSSDVPPSKTMMSSKIKDVSWAVFLLIVAPFRAVIRGICHPFVCKPRRSMENEIVLVTGAGQGLGRGMALEFAGLGATVVCWDINAVGCQETVELVNRVSRGQTATAYAYACDISKREEVAAVAKRVQEEVGQVTILVNNAGILSAGQLDRYKAEEISRLVSTNFTSHFWTIEAFLPCMKAVNSGQIVCISSMSSLMPSEYLVPYSATKCAVKGLMEALSEELASLGFNNIKLTTVYPYFSVTEGLKDYIKKYDQDSLGIWPHAIQPSQVVKNIVQGVAAKKREFSIPTYMMPFTEIIKILPPDVVRSWKQLLMGKWKFIMGKGKNPICAD